MRTGINSIINFGGSVAGLFLFALLTPLYLQAIGAERYGLLMVILALSAYVGVFNIGMGPALTYQVAGELRTDVAAQSEAFWSAMLLSAPVALVASALVFGLLPLGVASMLHLSEAIRAELYRSLPALTGIGIVTILTGNVRGMLAGREAFISLAVMGFLEASLGVLIPALVAIYISPEIPTLLLAIMGGRLLILTATWAYCVQWLLGRQPPRVSVARTRSLLGYGTWTSLGVAVETIISSADRVVLGITGGTEKVTVYSIPQSVASRSMIIPLSLLTAVFPRLVREAGVDDRNLTSSIVQVYLSFTPGYVTVVLTAAPLLGVWISPEMSDLSSWPLQLLTVAFWLEGAAAIYFFKLNAEGAVRANFLIVFYIAAPYCTALAAGALIAGPTGVAAVFLARNFVLLIVRARASNVKVQEVRAVMLHLSVLLLAVTVAPHRWDEVTPAPQMAAVLLLSLAAAFLTRPREVIRLAYAAIFSSRRS